MTHSIKDISFHYTSRSMAKDLISITPFLSAKSVLDAGSGKNKVWFENLPDYLEKFECEIEDGMNFFDWQQKVDWVIGNPPYHLSWKFTEKALEVADLGIAWLINNQALNSHFTPCRIEMMQNNGFFLQKIHVVSDKRWFGRYYYLIFTKNPTIILTYRKESY